MLNPSLDRRGPTRKTALVSALVAVCVLLPVAALRAPAQALSGSFTGSVYDPSGAVVPNATVIMTNQATHTKDMSASGAAGQFKFRALPAGQYELSVMSPGFQAYRLSPVVLEAGRDSTRNVTLELGAVNETVDVVAEGTPRSAPVADKGLTPQRIRVGGNVQATRLLHRVKPAYPEIARSAGVEGSVILEAVIGVDGRLLSLRVMNSQIDPDLARAAVEAVSQWRYRPTLLNGVPVEVVTHITVNFKLAS